MHRLAVVLALLLAAPALAQEAPATQPAPAAEQPQYEGLSVTVHQRGDLRYRAVAGTLPMNDDDGKLRGEMFFVSYERLADEGDGPIHDDPNARRPVTYVFNGGPGAASVWLHLGTAGPVRIEVADDGTPLPPPSLAVPNDDTWLTATDLCFIDPIGTGFSRPAGEDTDAAKTFYGVAQDVRWVGEFIRLHATRFGRWDDPKFLAGESYGTTRAAQLASYLHGRAGLDVSGVILISTVLDFATIREADNNPLPSVLFLPTYAATAAFHGKTDLTPDEARREAEAFAVDRYLPALMKGTLLVDDERQQIAAEYARLTGLPVDYVLASDLRVPPARFMKRLLNDDRKIVGRMDGRLTGHDPDPVGDTPSDDPSLGPYLGVYTGAFTDYVRNDLDYESDLPYDALSGRVRDWQAAPETQRSYSGGYLNVADDLEAAMREVPGLRLMIASGVYDLATPYFAADYTAAQLDLPPEARGRVTQTYYGGGHMMYHVAAEREAFGRDVRRFIADAASREYRGDDHQAD